MTGEGQGWEGTSDNASDGDTDSGTDNDRETEEPLVVDARGLRCPMPVIAAARVAASARQGRLLVVVATDPAAAVDLPAWCRMRGHHLLSVTTTDAADDGPEAAPRIEVLIRLGPAPVAPTT